MLKLSYSNDEINEQERLSVYSITLERKTAVMDLTKTEDLIQVSSSRFTGDFRDAETWDELQVIA